jgi:hypothetical protein
MKIKRKYTLDYDYTIDGATYDQRIKEMVRTFSLLTPKGIVDLP